MTTILRIAAVSNRIVVLVNGILGTDFTTLTVTAVTKQRFHLRSTKASGTDVDRVLLICS